MITSEQAKDIINKVRYEYTFNCSKNSLDVIKALDMAIDALSRIKADCKYKCRFCAGCERYEVQDDR